MKVKDLIGLFILPTNVDHKTKIAAGQPAAKWRHGSSVLIIANVQTLEVIGSRCRPLWA